MKAYEYIVTIKDKATNTLQRVARMAGVADNKIKHFGNRVRSIISATNLWNSATKRLATTLVALFTMSQVTAFTNDIIRVRSEFEKYEAVLSNTFQSQAAGRASMDMIRDFAATTPFQLNELTGSYVKLVNRGFIPAREQMTALGDLAASQGKSFNQLTEAILDAETGEFERLKEFGIKASKAGDKVTFTFKGVKKTVGANAKSIRGYILSLGKLKGVSKSMEVISQTLGGKISNLKDKFDNLKNSLGERLQPVLSWVIDGLGKMVDLVENNIPVFIALGGAITAVGMPIMAATGYTYAMAMASKFLTAELKKQFVLWLTNPYYWIALAVLALIGGLLYLYQTNEKVRYAFNYLGGVFQSLYTNFQTWYQGVKEGLTQWWQGVKQAFWAVFGTLIGRIKQTYQHIKRGLQIAIKWIVQKWLAFKNWFVGLWDKVKEIAGRVKTWFITAFNAIRERFKGFFDPIINGIHNMVRHVKNKIINLLNILKGKLTDWLGIDIDGMIAGLKKMGEGQKKIYTESKKFADQLHEDGKKAGAKGVAQVRANGGKFSGIKEGLPDFLQEALGGGNDADTTSAQGTGAHSGVSNISSGGSKQTNISVHFDKLQDTTEIHTITMEEGAEEMEEKLNDMFLRVLNSVSQMQTSIG